MQTGDLLKQCPECGQPAPLGAGFCSRCGHAFKIQFDFQPPLPPSPQAGTPLKAHEVPATLPPFLDALLGIAAIGSGLYFGIAALVYSNTMRGAPAVSHLFANLVGMNALAALSAGVLTLARNKWAFPSVLAVSFAAVMIRVTSAWAGGTPSGFWWELLPGLYALYRMVSAGVFCVPLSGVLPRAPIVPHGMSGTQSDAYQHRSGAIEASLSKLLASFVALPYTAKVAVGATPFLLFIIVIVAVLGSGRTYSSTYEYFQSRRNELGATSYSGAFNALVDGRKAEWIIWYFPDGTKRADLVAVDAQGRISVVGDQSRVPSGYQGIQPSQVFGQDGPGY